MRIDTKFNIGTKVHIDGDESIKGIVLAVTTRGSGLNITYDVGWMHNGCSQSAWIEEGRLSYG